MGYYKNEIKKLGGRLLLHGLAIFCLLAAVWSWFHIEKVTYLESDCPKFFDFASSCKPDNSNRWGFLVLAILFVLAAIGIWIYIFINNRNAKKSASSGLVIAPAKKS